MPDLSEQKRESKTYEEENLKDTFLSVFFIGLFIVGVWLTVFLIYINRL